MDETTKSKFHCMYIVWIFYSQQIVGLAASLAGTPVWVTRPIWFPQIFGGTRALLAVALTAPGIKEDGDRRMLLLAGFTFNQSRKF